MISDFMRELQADLRQFMREKREQGVALESPEAADQIVQWLLERVDIVPRGEFDAQVELLERASKRADELGERIKALENARQGE